MPTRGLRPDLDPAREAPVALERSRRVAGERHRIAQVNVAARASDHQIEVSWLDDTLSSPIGEVEHLVRHVAVARESPVRRGDSLCQPGAPGVDSNRLDR
ncbi:hypothetical protein Bxe_C1364 [Paraburkholderia xenovorans LB400]|uniref:Uncharacterized protein n=1 Tax=Paraburkholderia xenovorans (strain LB400) TaxID=266265 RepID=Q13FC7_PARXL|nr:hypothetical protein Bxe_C1364 [Paraburkholderia xenovorans LB400]